MNVFDLIILAVLAVSVIFALRDGTVGTVLSTGALLLAAALAFPLSKPLAAQVSGDTTVTSTLLTYTDALARVGDYDLAHTQVYGIDDETIGKVLDSVGLPPALSQILSRNLKSGAAIESTAIVNDYVQGAVLSAAIRVLSYLLVVLIIFLALSLLIRLADRVFHYPLLRMFDWVPAALFGLARGAVLSGLLALLIPLALTVIPLPEVHESLQASSIARHFMNVDYFLRIFHA